MSVDTVWLDVKLGLRMLIKHPGLTLIGVVATSFAIGAGAVLIAPVLSPCLD